MNDIAQVIVALAALLWVGSGCWESASRRRQEAIEALEDEPEPAPAVPADKSAFDQLVEEGVDPEFATWYQSQRALWENNAFDPGIDADFHEVQNGTQKGIELLRAAGWPLEEFRG